MKCFQFCVVVGIAAVCLLGCSTTKETRTGTQVISNEGSPTELAIAPSNTSTGEVLRWGEITLKVGEPTYRDLPNGRQCELLATSHSEGKLEVAVTTRKQGGNGAKTVLAMSVTSGSSIRCNLDGQLVDFIPVIQTE